MKAEPYLPLSEILYLKNTLLYIKFAAIKNSTTSSNYTKLSIITLGI